MPNSIIKIFTYHIVNIKLTAGDRVEIDCNEFTYHIVNIKPKNV